MQQVINELQHIRRWARTMLIAHRTAQLVSWTIGIVFALIVFDYFVRLPGTLRLAMLLAGIGGMLWGLGWYLRQVVVFWPSLTQIALRAEQTLPSLQGRLASSLEFVTAGLSQTNPLAARAVNETETRLQGASIRRVLAPKRAVRDIVVMSAAVALAVLLIIVNPAAAQTGLSRLFLPFGNAQWPARTGVASLMDQVLQGREIYPRGVALPLRAQVTRGADEQRVDAYYRLREEGRFGNWQHIVLTHQSEGVQERLVDTNAEEIQFYFHTADARTSREAITLVTPPAVNSAALVVTPPAYASGRYPGLEAQLGPGVDDRAVTDAPSLIGSDIAMRLELNKPLPVPEDMAAREAWVAQTFGFAEGESLEFALDPVQPTLWTLTWQLRRTRTLNLSLVDEYGLTNSEPISYRIDAIEDFPPSVTITKPQADEAVLATAIVPLVSEASDDVAVAEIGLDAAVDRSGVDEDVAESELPAVWSERRDVDALTANIETELDLSQLELVEGDIVLVTGSARDMYELDGETHDPVRSTVRRLRVISELELATQLRRQLAAVRHNAIRVEAHQGELQDDVTDAGVQPGTDRAQGQIGDRVATQLEQVREIRDLMERNQLDDAQLQELLRQSEDLLDFAGRASTRASELIEQRKAELAEARALEKRDREARGEDAEDAGRREDAGAQPGSEPSQRGEAGQPSRGEQPQPGQPQAGEDAGDEQEPRDEIFDLDDIREPAEEDREIVEQQQEVRDELTDLIELLDRDEDSWVITRQVKTLLEDQERLAAETGQLSRETLGQTREQLTDEQRNELDRIRDKQMELRDRARQITDSARKRAESLEEHDPQAAEGMRNAADEAEQRELDRDMEQAAQRAGENRLQQASNSQQRSMETLRRMLEQMEETKRAQAEQLLRQLASLIESIERLITIQENELTALARAEEDGDFSDRDRAMIRLNQNTQAVAAEARAAGQESRRIARALDRAADAQGAAVTALRAIPIDAPKTREAEERSLELLKQAKELAEALQQQTQEEETRRQREELIEAYRGFAEQEVALRQDTLQLAGNDELDRRQLVEARRLGSTQERIRSGLDDLRSRTTELMESRTFSLVHQLIDDWAAAVSDRLAEGEVGPDVTDREQQIADSIGRLIAALEESLLPPEEFAQDQEQQGGGAGGQQGQQPLIPPVAELKLLQGMQQQVYEQTREIDSRGDLEPAQRRSRLRDLGQQQRDLLDIGRELIEKMTGGGGGPAPVPSGDESEPQPGADADAA